MMSANAALTSTPSQQIIRGLIINTCASLPHGAFGILFTSKVAERVRWLSTAEQFDSSGKLLILALPSREWIVPLLLSYVVLLSFYKRLWTGLD